MIPKKSALYDGEGYVCMYQQCSAGVVCLDNNGLRYGKGAI